MAQTLEWQDLTSDDVALIRMLRGAAIRADALVTLPSGRVVTGKRLGQLAAVDPRKG